MPKEEHTFLSNPVGRRAFVGGSLGTAGAAAMVLASPSRPVQAAEGDSYVVQWKRHRQTILGLGYEIQSDSIGSGNNGLPDAQTSVPHDLVKPERHRFYNEMLRAGGDRGFRYCRLAMGLYLRGLSEDGKNIVGRWPEQMSELAEMVKHGKTESMMVEYWSPAPHWKSNDSYIGGTLKSGDQGFLSEFADALVGDVEFLERNNLPVSWWGLQNEPEYSTPYSSCVYGDDLYYNAFRTAASRLRSQFPGIRTHVNSNYGHTGPGGEMILEDPATLSLTDAWTWHRIGFDSNDQINKDFRDGAGPRAAFSNEFEYQPWSPGDTQWRTVNTAQSIMNWMVFQDSPTWVWLHALKPTYNSEATGYSLGFWRPWDDDNFEQFPDIKKGHWAWNDMNWNGLSGFLRNMPWDSVRVEVDEPEINGEHRIMAWLAPNGKRTFVVTNRSDQPYTFQVDVGERAMFKGSRYAHDLNAVRVGEQQGPALSLDVPAYSIEFWTE
ncbi:hypothetical protein GCM10027403_17250 [Arthrobacter tecti]